MCIIGPLPGDEETRVGRGWGWGWGGAGARLGLGGGAGQGQALIKSVFAPPDGRDTQAWDDELTINWCLLLPVR